MIQSCYFQPMHAFDFSRNFAKPLNFRVLLVPCSSVLAGSEKAMIYCGAHQLSQYS